MHGVIAEMAATTGVVACPPQVTMFTFGAPRCSSRLTAGTTQRGLVGEVGGGRGGVERDPDLGENGMVDETLHTGVHGTDTEAAATSPTPVTCAR